MIEVVRCFYFFILGLDFMETDNFQLQNEGTYKGLQAYKNSKLCNVLFTYHLADKLAQEKVLVNAVDPGEKIFQRIILTHVSQNASVLKPLPPQ